jgi:hypothetical protein
VKSRCYCSTALELRQLIGTNLMEEVIMSKRRTELQREVAEALISTKAVDFEAIGSVLGKYGARAALAGDAIWVNIHWRVMDICIPPFLTGAQSVLPTQFGAREQE